MGCLRIDLLPQVGKKSDDLGATIVQSARYFEHKRFYACGWRDT